MNIALMAHDRKKELMVQFCIAYCGILAEHSLCATHVTGKLVSEERLCDQYQIPFATNAATAEVLVQGLRRGDLDWRNIVNPQKR